MAVDLSSLLPQSQAGDTSPHVPSSNVNAFHMSEFTSPGSLFEKESGTGFDSYMADCTSVEASYFKAESFYKEDNVEEFEKVDCDQPSPDVYRNDSWMTTPVSLPSSPDCSTPNSPSVFHPRSATHTLMTLPTYQQAAPLHSQPLTLDSSSPHSHDSKREKDLMDILSFLQEPAPSVNTEYDNFYSFQLPVSSYDQMSAVSSADDVSSSIYSTSPSLLSTQDSPLSLDLSTTYSPNLSPQNSNFSPLHSPLSPDLSPHPQASTPSDTIHDLLPHSSVHGDETSSNIPLPSSRFVKPEVPNTGSNSLKRKSDSSLDGSSSKKCAVSGSIPHASRSKKRAVTGTRKERKREQNKTAALRYRQKKKDEKIEIDDRESLLEEKNALLKSTLYSLEAEVDYLKKLWDEMSTRQHSIPSC